MLVTRAPRSAELSARSISDDVAQLRAENAGLKAKEAELHSAVAKLERRVDGIMAKGTSSKQPEPDGNGGGVEGTRVWAHVSVHDLDLRLNTRLTRVSA